CARDDYGSVFDYW
nr:immunoglobulin heavy chain junction region [Macaca mulatta]MOW20637.1 immunoglobulin heavy chain junction region [Macaca mulatta]MOW20714.1 immunoglobulin heavy chain junction region [Macaca mulatta]MOW21027.1 immunoglobulin heavy chain junction region [Macaca mulatta]MOW21114.1 immunoglobulin heavy chain junction region [Macaca mulatta]